MVSGVLEAEFGHNKHSLDLSYQVIKLTVQFLGYVCVILFGLSTYQYG